MKQIKWKLAFFLRLSIKKKIIYGSLILFFIFAISYSVVFITVLKYNNDRYVENVLSSTCEKIDTDVVHYFSQMDNTASTIRFNRLVQKLLKQESNVSELEHKTRIDSVGEFLSNLSDVSYGNSFYVVDTAGKIVNNKTAYDFILDFPIDDPDWMEYLYQTQRVVKETTHQYAHLSQKNWGVNIYYPIVDNYNLFEVIGYLVICIPNQNLSFLVDGHGENILVEIVGTADQIIAENSHQYVEEEMPLEISDEVVSTWKDYKIYAKTMDEYQWNIRVMCHRNLDEQKDASMFFWILLVVVPSTMLLVALGVLLSHYLTTPIIRCKDALLQIQQNNDIGLQIEHPYQDEIGQLLDGFNEMSLALDSLIHQNKKMDSLRRDTELAMLHQKINPHFLYNTLDLINGLILTSHTTEAMEVCEMLGQMFRYNLKDAQHITLEQEYQYICRYLHIAQLKKQNLVVAQDIDDAILNTRIPKMILQPIIENALKYGFTPQQEECCLSICICQQQDQIKLEVMDNGKGMEASVAEHLQQRLISIRADKLQQSNPHVGLENIYHRLLLEYHGKFEFFIHTKEGYGTRITILLPKGDVDSNV